MDFFFWFVFKKKTNNKNMMRVAELTPWATEL